MQNDVLFGIMLTLLGGKRTTAKQLATKYELSVRTIYRYLDALNQAGVPLVSYVGSGGGVCIADNFKLDKTYFTKSEYERILASLASFDELTGEENRLLKEKFENLAQADDTQYVLQSDNLFIKEPVSDSMRHKIAAFQNAVYNKKVCALCYHSRKGEVTNRMILPHAFAINNGQWYVLAFCRMRGEFRLFKLSRVYSVVVEDETFERMPIPQSIINEDEAKIFKEIELALKVNEESRLDVEEWLGIENVRKSGDGYFASSKVLLNDELISKLLSFGGGVKIIAPAEVEEAVKLNLKKALQAYK